MKFQTLMTSPEITYHEDISGQRMLLATVELTWQGVSQCDLFDMVGLTIGMCGYGGFFDIKVSKSVRGPSVGPWQSGFALTNSVEQMHARLPELLMDYYSARPTELSLACGPRDRAGVAHFDSAMVARFGEVSAELLSGKRLGRVPL